MSLHLHTFMRFYRPSKQSSWLDGEMQLLRLQWGTQRLHDMNNGKATVKAWIERRPNALGLSWRSGERQGKRTVRLSLLWLVFQISHSPAFPYGKGAA